MVRLIDHTLIDPGIVPDEKERLFKEALEGFRRGSHLDEALRTISFAIDYTIRDEKIKMIYNLTAMSLEQDRNAMIDHAVTKYLASKEL